MPRPPKIGGLGTRKSSTVPKNRPTHMRILIDVDCACSKPSPPRVLSKMAEQVEGKTKSNRGVLWSEDATKALISMWGEEDIQLSLENSKSSKETREVYRSVMVSCTAMKSERMQGTSSQHVFFFIFYCLGTNASGRLQ